MHTGTEGFEQPKGTVEDSWKGPINLLTCTKTECCPLPTSVSSVEEPFCP